MPTQEFWKFAKTVTSKEKIADVYERYAAEAKLNAFEKEFIWKAVNKDMETSFHKYADDISKPIGIAIEKVMEGLPNLLNSLGADGSSEVEEPVKDESIKAEPDVTPIEEKKSEPEVADQKDTKPLDKPEDASKSETSTVFDAIV